MSTKFKQEWTDAELRKVIRKFSLWAPSHLQITHGNKERTIEDTYGLPYTSSGECAGVWNTNVEAVLRDDPTFFFQGVLLTEANEVVAWFQNVDESAELEALIDVLK